MNDVLTPMYRARYEIERSRLLVMESRIRRENLRCELVELRQARDNKRKVKP